MILEEVKDELNKLCTDYLNILQQLKDQKIINEETFKMCSINKKSFLEKLFTLYLHKSRITCRRNFEKGKNTNSRRTRRKKSF